MWSRAKRSQKIRGFIRSNYRQMSMLLNLICDTGRSRISVGSRRTDPPEAQGFWATLNYLSDEHAFIP